MKIVKARQEHCGVQAPGVFSGDENLRAKARSHKSSDHHSSHREITDVHVHLVSLTV